MKRTTIEDLRKDLSDLREGLARDRAERMTKASRGYHSYDRGAIQARADAQGITFGQALAQWASAPRANAQRPSPLPLNRAEEMNNRDALFQILRRLAPKMGADALARIADAGAAKPMTNRPPSLDSMVVDRNLSMSERSLLAKARRNLGTDADGQLIDLMLDAAADPISDNRKARF